MRAPGELRAAVGLGTAVQGLASGLAPHEMVEGLAWLPVVGLACGAVAAAAADVAGGLGPIATAVAAVAALALLDGRWRGGVLPVITLLVEAGALTKVGGTSRTVALLVAPMLARWAIVVQCYGGVPVSGARDLAALVGRARFREFALASVTALGVALVLLDAVGLAVALVAALVTIAVRVAAYRWAGGLTTRALDATSALVEASALVLLSLVSLALRTA
ncbi:MAG TPA: hypothetical protein VMS22_20485 [Candidatus Eisenbacteria bacterium]|nr:hypothetical protein [Candidatus Eisenbacteria bacterium]